MNDLDLSAVLTLLALAAGALLVAVLGFRACLVRAAPDEALVVRTMGRAAEVHFGSRVVPPIVTHVERMTLAPASFLVVREEGTGLVCRDALRADVRAEFQLKVRPHGGAILAIASEIGCERAVTPETLELLFAARFAEAMRETAAQHTMAELEADPDAYGDVVQERIGTELRGYELERVRITKLRRTARAHLDPHNIHDARALRRLDEVEAERIG